MKKYKVVIVDDEPLQRQGLAVTTPWDRFECVLAEQCGNVSEAIEAIRKHRPDIVITDIKMPGKSGLELIETFQNDMNGEFIIITGYALFEYAKKALDLGVGSFLLKPVDDEELSRALEKAISALKTRRKTEKEEEIVLFNSNAPSASYLRRALEFVEMNCSKDLTIKDVAENLNISTSYLWKLFRKHVDLTFNEYLTKSRMQKAKQLLKTEDLKIYEISEACGYKDYRYFSSVFKKYVGLNPTDYRKTVDDMAP